LGLNLAQKIIQDHLIQGEMKAGQEIALRIDHTLLHDTLGLMALLEFEAMGLPQVKTKRSVVFTDHNTLQLSPEGNDDHRFIQSMAAKYGMLYSRAGNGICHQVQLERFSEPGVTLLGADSHTPTAGAVGSLAIGAGGLDVAVAMGGAPYRLKMPRIVRVNLTGRLQPWVSSKDVVLELLRQKGVKGGLDCIFEFGGEGVRSLTVPERGTICNMGTELGATSSIFPSDETVLSYLKAQGRDAVWRALSADPDAEYDETIEIDLGALEPLIACPSSPDAVVAVREVEGTPIGQVCIGSCTNSSYLDLMAAATILKGKVVPSSVSLVIAPGSRQVLHMISASGALTDLIDAGARILEATCGPCIGMGQAPGTGVASLRTFNRNFPGRSGTKGDKAYLCSPQVAAASAVAGQITDPRRLGEAPLIELPERFPVDDRMIVKPSAEPEKVEIFRGPSIKPLPIAEEAPLELRGRVLLKTGDNITTDDIAPSGARVAAFRANVPAMAEFTFADIDASFPQRAKESEGGVILGGRNYGQGSSREHAALQPMYLGIKAVLAKSFARIHEQNLTNFGILALTFTNETDYDRVEEGDLLELPGLREAVVAGHELVVRNATKGIEIPVKHAMTPRTVQVYLDGGLLNHVKKQAN